MADAIKFPDIGHPCLPTSSGSGSSHTVNVQDSTISTTSDANYKHTRPRTTRMIRTWTFAWNGVPEVLMKKLLAFYRQVGTFQAFSFTDWNMGETHTVRFAEALSYQFNYPGYSFTLKFEEV
ncbi:hypothetical protein HMPREF9334_00331 [Selenomonas infelix ATCC 43532]|jgi:hypothetical protein|uniref:Phage minor tail protein n=1 Tax=Selenomonas infelix ATCC 43532 TaxID=679201 RepID=G5GM50_9FIRM|nr:hypothetical protein [Selenomonas infelix]EHG22295.1 hypothetical protein HMPREF9334_00331 [Selenomonas infelix ATCC 43532]DAX49084.1 MAG TPA: protein of unknown function DUF2460 [Caudoviricetes sp.]